MPRHLKGDPGAASGNDSQQDLDCCLNLLEGGAVQLFRATFPIIAGSQTQNNNL